MPIGEHTFIYSLAERPAQCPRAKRHACVQTRALLSFESRLEARQSLSLRHSSLPSRLERRGGVCVFGGQSSGTRRAGVINRAPLGKALLEADIINRATHAESLPSARLKVNVGGQAGEKENALSAGRLLVVHEEAPRERRAQRSGGKGQAIGLQDTFRRPRPPGPAGSSSLRFLDSEKGSGPHSQTGGTEAHRNRYPSSPVLEGASGDEGRRRMRLCRSCWLGFGTTQSQAEGGGEGGGVGCERPSHCNVAACLGERGVGTTAVIGRLKRGNTTEGLTMTNKHRQTRTHKPCG